MIKVFGKLILIFCKGLEIEIVFLILATIFASFLELLGISLIFPAIALLGQNANVPPPLFYRYLRFFDVVPFAHGNSKIFLLVLIGIVFVLKNGYLCAYYGIQLRFAEKLKKRISNRFLLAMSFAPLEYHLERSSSLMANLFSSLIHFVVNNFFLQFLAILSQGALIFFLLSYLLVYFFSATVTIVLILCLFLLIQSSVIRRINNRLGQEYNPLRIKHYGLILKLVSGIKDVKIYRQEEAGIKSFNHNYSLLTTNERKMFFLQHLTPLLSDSLIVIVLVCSALSIMLNPLANAFVLPILATFAAAAYRLSPAINRFLHSYSLIRSSISSAHELLHEISVLDQMSVECMNSSKNNESIIFQRLNVIAIRYRYHYDQRPFLLELPPLEISSGEFIGIVGASGSGKSTLLQLLLGLLWPDSEGIKINGVKLTPSYVGNWRAICAYVHPELYLIDGTLEENITFGRKYHDDLVHQQRLSEAIRMSQLLEYCSSLPLGVHTPVGENGKNISSGQRQRVGLARAFYGDPQLIFLDEATSSLDYKTEDSISSALLPLIGDKTIIAVSHRLHTLKNCHRIIYLKDGKLVAIATMDELRQLYPEFEKTLEFSQH